MELMSKPLGELIEAVSTINSELKYGPDDVRGMTITKEIIPTKANVQGTDLNKFYVVGPREFIYNPRTHGKKIGLGFNDTELTFIISWNNTAFRVKKSAEAELLPEYLYMHFNRPEWDREACFNSWGSSTEVFSWEALCEMPILLPSIDIQRKYVDIYEGLKKNIAALAQGIERMQKTCDTYMERLLNNAPNHTIGEYIEEYDEQNSDSRYEEADVRGISTQKTFIITKANMNGVSLSNYKCVRPSCFAYVSDTSRRGDKISLAYNNSDGTYLVSSITTTFEVTSKELVPEYLFMFLCRSEFDRYARYNSWGSARETISWEDFCDFSIPVPEKNIQQDIVTIFETMSERKTILDRLTELKKNICPVLIKGAVEEGSRS